MAEELVLRNVNDCKIQVKAIQEGYIPSNDSKRDEFW